MFSKVGHLMSDKGVAGVKCIEHLISITSMPNSAKVDILAWPILSGKFMNREASVSGAMQSLLEVQVGPLTAVSVMNYRSKC